MRSTLRRSGPVRRRASVGRAARKRIRDGGPLAHGRESLSIAGLDRLREMLMVRANGRSEWSGLPGPLQLEHAIFRSHGGRDAWDTTWLATPTENAQRHASYEKGRLLVFPQGDGRFVGQFVRGTKDSPEVLESREFGRPPTDEERAELESLR